MLRERISKDGQLLMEGRSESMGEAIQLRWNSFLQLYKCRNEEQYDEVLEKTDLPLDLILYDIVTRLPIISVLQYKSVSKQWYNFLSSSHFGNAHFSISTLYRPFSIINCVFIHSGKNYYLCCIDEDEGETDHVHAQSEKGLFKLDIDFGNTSHDEIFLIGSCNGLVCLYSLLGYIIIWNPIIHKWTKCSYPLAEGFLHFSWGFGHVSLTNDYKVVRISCSEESRVTTVDVFSLRTQKWKQVHDDSLNGYSLFYGTMSNTSAGVFINETVYWIMNKRGHGEKQSILGFNLVHEKFQEIRGLISGDSYLSSFQYLGCMGGSLAMGRVTNSGDVSISILKQNGQIEYIGLYRDMNLRSCSAVVGYTKGGKFLIQLGNQFLGLVDPSFSPKKYTRVVTFQEQGNNTRVLSHTPSLISPFAVAETHEEQDL